jgi:hypothetical protein
VYLTHDQERDARIRRALAALAHSTPSEPPDVIGRNVASILETPLDDFPEGVARWRVLALALVGHDVYAYQSGGPSGYRCLWLVRERVTCAEWRQWHVEQERHTVRSPAPGR